MSRALVILAGKRDREKAAHWCMTAPPMTAVEFRQSKRTTDQNAKMWALLTDVARQVEWHGVKLSPEDWKLIFMDALGAELRLVPNIGGNGFINLGRSSSKLTKQEFSDLIELIHAFCAERGVEISDPTIQRQDAA